VDLVTESESRPEIQYINIPVLLETLVLFSICKADLKVPHSDISTLAGGN
jgi:hypothetical protein